MNKENQRLIFDYVVNHTLGEIESYNRDTMPVSSDSENGDPLNFSGKSEKQINIKLIFSSSTTIEELKKYSHFSSNFLDLNNNDYTLHSTFAREDRGYSQDY